MHCQGQVPLSSAAKYFQVKKRFRDLYGRETMVVVPKPIGVGIQVKGQVVNTHFRCGNCTCIATLHGGDSTESIHRMVREVVV